MDDAVAEAYRVLTSRGAQLVCNSETFVDMIADAFKTYDDHRQLASRDSLSTAPELAKKIATVRSHLAGILQIIAQDLAVVRWLDEFSKDTEVDEPPGGGFSKALYRCIDAARRADEHFAEAVVDKESLTINRLDGSCISHTRRTRTESRDQVLIPLLLGSLYCAGLRLRSADQWDLDALDLACEVVAKLLANHDVSTPASGDTARGEANQGKLRRLVKASWNQLESTLTNRRAEQSP